MSITALPTSNRYASAESISATMRRLRDEAQAHAREHSLILASAIAELEVLALDIAEGGEPYLGGVRETARRLGGELTSARMRLDALLGREGL